MSDSHTFQERLPDLTGKTVWAIDTLSRVYQLFHALPEMSSPDGTPVGAVYGFARDLLDVVENKRPDYLVCAIDAPGPTFRHERFEAYKATRAAMPADLVPQIDLVRRLLFVMDIPALEITRFEADDILATIATRTVRAGGSCIIATSDKDARQLLSSHVTILNLRSGQPFRSIELEKEWGIRPDQVVDFLSLVGDAVDNVPGVPLIGPKIASELLNQFGTLDEILAHVDDVKGNKRRENLKVYADTARFSRELVQLDCDVPLEIPWEAAKRTSPDPDRLADFLRELGFKSLVDKILTSNRSSPLLSKTVSSPAVRTESPQKQFSFGFDQSIDECAITNIASLSEECAIVEGDEALASLAQSLNVPSGFTISTAFLDEPTRGSFLGIAIRIPSAFAVWIPAAAVLEANPGAERLRAILENPSIKKRGHNLKRQSVALQSHGIRLRGESFDSLLADYLLDAGNRNHTLAEIARRHGQKIDVLTTDSHNSLEDPSSSCEASAVTELVETLSNRLSISLEEAALSPLFTSVEMPLSSLLADMEYRGVRIDEGTLSRLSTEYAERLSKLEEEIHALAGHPFLIASPLQVRTVLFDELALPVVKRTKTGPSTDAEVLEELSPLHPLPKKLLEHRQYSKLKSTYVDALPALVDPHTGRIHTSFNQSITATGRLSSSRPNLQNIPIRSLQGREIRTAFVPGQVGWEFVAADYSQIELRILAHLSGDQVMRHAFETGEDIHTQTAAAVFHVDTEAVTAEMRRNAKAVNFGILYGQSAFGLAASLRISKSEAAAFIAAYFQAFCGAAEFIDRVLEDCAKEGQVKTILGRRRMIRGVRDSGVRKSGSGGFSLTLPEREAINTVVQGSAADLMKLAMLRVDERLRRESMQAGIVLQIHDELVLESPPEETSQVRQILVDEMQSAMALDVPLIVSIHGGANWDACDKQ